MLSIFNYRDRRRDKLPSLKITFDIGTWAGRPPHGVILACVRAVNTGQRMVSMEEIGGLLPDKRKLLFNVPLVGDKLPCGLLPGQRGERYQAVTELAASLATAGYGEGVRLRGYMRDAESRYFVTKPRRFFTEGFIAAQKEADAS